MIGQPRNIEKYRQPSSRRLPFRRVGSEQGTGQRAEERQYPRGHRQSGVVHEMLSAASGGRPPRPEQHIRRLTKAAVGIHQIGQA